jgi:RNA polymerase sigma-70 factor (sigma-E family)
VLVGGDSRQEGGGVDATGDPAFLEFVRSRSAALLRSAYLLTGDRHLAEDLVQTALAKTALRWHRIEHRNAEAYTRRVLYHEQVDGWRRKRVAEAFPGDLPDRADRYGSESERSDLKLVVQEALSRLGPRQRAVVILRFFEDRTERETAEILGCSIGTVKSQAHRALATLRSAAPNLLDLNPTGRGIPTR